MFKPISLLRGLAFHCRIPVPGVTVHGAGGALRLAHTVESCIGVNLAVGVVAQNRQLFTLAHWPQVQVTVFDQKEIPIHPICMAGNRKLTSWHTWPWIHGAVALPIAGHEIEFLEFGRRRLSHLRMGRNSHEYQQSVTECPN